MLPSFDDECFLERPTSEELMSAANWVEALKDAALLAQSGVTK